VHSDELGSDRAHLTRVELRTPKPGQSLTFWKPVVWSEAERRRGQAWGLQTVASFHTYGTPPVDEAALGPTNAVG